MKKRIFILVLFISFSIKAQNKNQGKISFGSISGTVLDLQTKKPLPYVSITCKTLKDNILTGVVTNRKGVFIIKRLPLDTLFIDIQFIGYKKVEKKIIIMTAKEIKIPTLYLEEETAVLDAVIIESERASVIQKIDRRVINISKDLASTGTNSLQMLENIPSVEVNLQSGTISLRGNENVRVLIDGKPSSLSTAQLLKQLPSSSVKSVELITNPSAKYNPEGMSGIINILLKKNSTRGFNGAISLGAEQSINRRPTGSLNFNYQTGKVNFYGNYGVDSGKFETFAAFDRTDKNLSQRIDYLDHSTSHYIKSGVDFYMNTKNTLSFYTTQNFIDTDFFVNTKTRENGNTILNTTNLSVYYIKEQLYNLNYKLDLDDKGQHLEFEISHSESSSPQNDFMVETINPIDKIYNYTNTIINDNRILLMNIDYVKPLKNGTLELGIEARNQKSFNYIITDQEVETGSIPSTLARGNSTFNYDREIYSTYINLNTKYKKIGIQAGLRFEQFSVDGLFSNTIQTDTEVYTDAIFSIYPSAFLTYHHSENNEFQFGYSRRVDRPGINQVTPIQEWTSPLTISVGNRELTPQFTNSFEVNYTKENFTLGGFYRRTTDKIGRIINKDPLQIDRQILSYENYNTSDSYGIEISGSYKPRKWWTIRPSSSLYTQESIGFINDLRESIKNVLFRARISNRFQASKKLSFQLSGSYKGKSENVQFKVNPYFLVNASARLSVLKGKGTISIRGTDIFDNFKQAFSSSNPFPQTGIFTLEYSSIYLGFSYKFGSKKNKDRDRKYRENNETRGSGGVL
tara:strand:- start:788 stop:3187 length:2400 start_codon:yes stop_codon:yes gene_type:complete